MEGKWTVKKTPNPKQKNNQTKNCIYLYFFPFLVLKIKTPQTVNNPQL